LRKKIKVLGNNTGLGNQIQFIPIIELLKTKYDVFSDSNVFYELGILGPAAPAKKADINITVFGYDVKKFWNEKLRNSGKFFGFKYRVKGVHTGLGYDKSIRFDEKKNEIDNNIEAFRYFFNDYSSEITYNINKNREINSNKLVVGISPKKEKTLPISLWKKLIESFEEMGFTVYTVDHDIGYGNYVSTPSLSDLKNFLKDAAYYVGTDSGVMHLADILNIPLLIMFGSTSIAKNGPYNAKSKVISRELSCSPCYDWGRVNCPYEFRCMNFNEEYILNNFKELCQNQSQ
jgi:ADP-heptose:LPS heptosyltransferase